MQQGTGKHQAGASGHLHCYRLPGNVFGKACCHIIFGGEITPANLLIVPQMTAGNYLGAAILCGKCIDGDNR